MKRRRIFWCCILGFTFWFGGCATQPGDYPPLTDVPPEPPDVRDEAERAQAESALRRRAQDLQRAQ